MHKGLNGAKATAVQAEPCPACQHASLRACRSSVLGTVVQADMSTLHSIRAFLLYFRMKSCGVCFTWYFPFKCGVYDVQCDIATQTVNQVSDAAL